VQAAGPDSSKRLYDYVGPGESLMFPKGREDDTHLSMRGAIAVAGLVAKSLAHSTPALSKFVRATPAPVDTPEARLLWNGAAPGAVGDSTLDRPTITAYLPHSAVPTAAMVVFPGGGYDHLSTDKEGAQVARWLNSLGVAAFMVRYRVGPRYHQPAMIDDGLQAMRVVRENAAKWHIDPHRVGVIGFSAGGHLAGIVGTRSDASTRPDLMMLVYPVVTMDERWAHRGSRAMLLGASPSADLVRRSRSKLKSRAAPRRHSSSRAPTTPACPFRIRRCCTMRFARRKCPSRCTCSNRRSTGLGSRRMIRRSRSGRCSPNVGSRVADGLCADAHDVPLVRSG
jgi:acetyl esterase/lipase